VTFYSRGQSGFASTDPNKIVGHRSRFEKLDSGSDQLTVVESLIK
jgi:hypothetical protein